MKENEVLKAQRAVEYLEKFGRRIQEIRSL